MIRTKGKKCKKEENLKWWYGMRAFFLEEKTKEYLIKKFLSKGLTDCKKQQQECQAKEHLMQSQQHVQRPWGKSILTK